ncbi:hypothetical protein RIF29_25301 [Crotalaria pallida]|uniref:Uncharacterized protein n=1 Tax=Crotalaria pallida TaxID=3830 RepID=A0AAN9HXC8_CROPI
MGQGDGVSSGVGLEEVVGNLYEVVIDNEAQGEAMAIVVIGLIATMRRRFLFGQMERTRTTTREGGSGDAGTTNEGFVDERDIMIMRHMRQRIKHKILRDNCLAAEDN